MNIWQKLKRDLKEGWLSKAEKKYLKEFRAKVEELERNQLHIIPAPHVFEVINYRDLYNILKRKINAPILLADRKYQLTSLKEMKRFLREDKTDLMPYKVDYSDCDDSSWALLGMINQGLWAGIAFGFAWSDIHAFNIFVPVNKRIKIIEPQTDEIFDYDWVERPYKPIRLVMM